MTDTLIDAAAAGIEPALDREVLLERTMSALARLEKMYETARRKLRTARTADEFVQKVLEPKRALLLKMFSIGITPEDIADLFTQEFAEGGITMATKKLLAALRKFSKRQTGNSDVQTTGKKRGRKSNAEKAAAAQIAVQAADAAPNDQEPAGAQAQAAQSVAPGNSPAQEAKFSRNSDEIQPKLPGNSGASAPKIPTKISAKSPAKPLSASAPAAAPAAASTPPFKEETEQHKERMRRELPDWVARYQDDKKYAAAVQRREGESDIDYCWRMWHTRAPWAAEVNLPIWPSQTETDHIASAWDEKSPEERAAYRASLPTTAH